MFYGNFEDETDVFNSFQVDEKDRHGKVIIFAAYDCPDYEGYATVVFIEKGKLYVVTGSHCSCNGLEDQWDPDEMPVVALKKLATGEDYFYHHNEFKDLLEKLEYHGAFDMSPAELQVFLVLAY